MKGIVLVIVMAIVAEALIEYCKTLGKSFVTKEWKTAITQIISIAIGILLCFACDANLFSALSVEFSTEWVGIVLTGIFASRGSNYVSDFVKKIQSVKTEG